MKNMFLRPSRPELDRISEFDFWGTRFNERVNKEVFLRDDAMRFIYVIDESSMELVSPGQLYREGFGDPPPVIAPVEAQFSDEIKELNRWRFW